MASSELKNLEIGLEQSDIGGSGAWEPHAQSLIPIQVTGGSLGSKFTIEKYPYTHQIMYCYSSMVPTLAAVPRGG